MSGKTKDKILIVDDNATIRLWVKKRLESAEMSCVAVEDGESGLDIVDESYSAVLMDINLPGKDGVECVREIGRRLPDLPCLMISASEDVGMAVAAMKAGAFDYIRKPLDGDELLLLLSRALRTGHLDKENRYLRSTLGAADLPKRWTGVSSHTSDILDKIERIADSDGTVLITGETGTGKSLLARLIHDAGCRASHPFVTVSCATLPRDLVEAELFGHEKGAFTGATREKPGRVEVAGEGTLYLDEIGEMPMSLQPKVLRLLQEREYERVGGNRTHRMQARVIASTNRDLVTMSTEGGFREDLYFRLSVLPLEIPPLRERRDDIEPIVTEFVEQLSQKQDAEIEISPDALEAMVEYDWPGNVRELQNVLERAATFSEDPIIKRPDLVFLGRRAGGAGQMSSLAGRSLQEIEKAAIEQTLEKCGGNKAAAARMLGISEKSVYNKINRLGISPPTS